MIRKWGSWLGMATLVAGLAVILYPIPGRAEETPGPNDVRIGLVSSLFRDTPESLIQLLTKPLKSLMESQTGMSGTLAAGGDASHLGKQLQDDKFQLAVFHGVEFAWVRQKHPEFKPLVVAIRDGRPMHAILVVREDSKIAGVADLAGKSLALCRQCREHCRLFIERRCEACGKPYTQLCSEVTTPGDSEDALDDVVDGVVNAAVVDGASLDRYKKDKPERYTKLKAAQRSEPFPPAVIAYKPGVLSEKVLERFRDGLINANKNPKGKQLLNMCRLTCFEPVPDDYEQMLVAIAKAYPPPERHAEK